MPNDTIPSKCYRIEDLSIRVWRRTSASSNPVVVLRWRYTGLRPGVQDLWTLNFEFWAGDWEDCHVFSDLLAYLGSKGPEPTWDVAINALDDLDYVQDQDHEPL